MYQKAIKFVTNKNVHQSAIRLRAFSNVTTHHKNTDSNFVDDIKKPASGMPLPKGGDETFANNIRKSASGLPPSSAGVDDRVNVVKTSTTPSTPTYDNHGDDHDTSSSSFVADVAKQGVAKAMETGLNIGEMAKKTLDNVYDVTKDTTHMVKEAVTGDDKKNNDVPPSDRFVDDLRKHADGYDLKNKYK